MSARNQGFQALSPTDHSIVGRSPIIAVEGKPSRTRILLFDVDSNSAPYCSTWSFTSQFAGSGRMANVGSLPRTMATSSQL
jgi:hypothetical protein